MQLNRVKNILKDIIYKLWVMNGLWGGKSSLQTTARLTVLITYYNPARLKHINHQIRNLLKCTFVERIVISNHNPAFRIEDSVHVQDDRLEYINQDTRRGCGHRWLVAEKFTPQHLLVMDDDILLFPWQVKKLFAALLARPEIPHGYAGMVLGSDGTFDYQQRINRDVDYLCEIYAITAVHLNRYLQLRSQIIEDPQIAQIVERSVDFVIVSQTGSAKPEIHYAGHLLRCPTFNQTGVAVHKETTFLKDIQAVSSALKGRTAEPFSTITTAPGESKS